MGSGFLHLSLRNVNKKRPLRATNIIFTLPNT